MSQKLKVKLIHYDAKVPTRGSKKSSGLDLYALKDTVAVPGTTLVRTGVVFGIPDGYEIQIRPRSGLSLNTSLRVANAPGTIDQDYLGECKVIIWNTSDESVLINKGDRIAQAVLCPVVLFEVEEVDELETTERGEGSFGSTGT